jgi:hypothetical protein
MNNEIQAQPKIAAKLEAAYNSWATRAGVVPWDQVQKAPRTPAPI